MSDYSNADIQRMHDDNVRTTHALLTPFRWAGYFLRAIVIVLICVVWFFVKNVGWLVNFGPLSQGDRQEKISVLYYQADEAMRNMSDNKWGRFESDLRRPSDEKLWDSEEPWDDKDGNSGPMNPDQNEESFIHSPDPALTDTSLGPWSDRSDHSFERKSARMYIAYVTAIEAIADLRSCLHTYKHIPANRIRVPDAPVIGFRTQQIDFLPSDYYGHPPMLFTGMCLVSECEPGDFMFGTSKYGDLFSKVPPLTEHQENAVNALLNVTSNEFWVRTAHENGITDHDADIVEDATLTRNSLERDFGR